MRSFSAPILITVLLLFLTSCVAYYDYGEYRDVCPDMISRGNCLPFELDEIAINHTFDVCDEFITNVIFLTPSEVVGVTQTGDIFICNTDSRSSMKIAELGEENLWYLRAYNQNFFFVIEHFHRQENTDREVNDIYLMSRFGDICWKLEEYENIYGFEYDGESFLGVFRNSDGFAELVSIDVRSNISSLLILDDTRPFPVPVCQAGNEMLLWYYSGGPYTISKDNDYSEMTLWHDQWDNNLNPLRLDPAGRIIGFASDWSTNTYSYDLVILDRNISEPEIVRFQDSLDIQAYDIFDPWSDNKSVSSNGDKIVFTFTHYLIRYENGELDIWLNNLQEYADPDDTDFTVTPLYTDSNCETFILTLDTKLLYGQDEDSIEIIEFSEDTSTGLVFSEDFCRAAVATEDGRIIVLDLLPKE